MAQQPTHQVFTEVTVHDPAGAAVARHTAGEIALKIGFSAERSAEIKLIASELAYNHVNHVTQNGVIRISSWNGSTIPGLTITSLDRGPGIENIHAALAGRKPDRKGLGAGLISVQRLADRFAVWSAAATDKNCRLPREGNDPVTVITASCRPQHSPGHFIDRNNFAISVLIQPKKAETSCGDNVFLQEDKRYSRITIVDSPGVKSAAAMTSHIGRELERLALIWPPGQVLETLENTLRSTPGAAVHIMRLDRMAGELQCCCIGNIKPYLIIDNNLIEPPVQPAGAGIDRWRQIQSATYRSIRSVDCCMHTDGLNFLSKERINSVLTCLAGQPLPAQTADTVDVELAAHILFQSNPGRRDDAALLIWRWHHR